MKIHQLKIDFNVTDEIKRYVYVYILEAENLYLIDSGVYSCEHIIENYITSIGRRPAEIKAIFLTHAHPDHIGTAAYFKENYGAKVYASAGEAPWIEDIDLQFKERPIPNFYNLAGKSVKVDALIADGQIMQLERDVAIKAVATPGHSADEMSYIVGDNMFIGDAVPVKGDIPIYVSLEKTMQSFEKLMQFNNINTFYPAWDHTYSKTEMMDKIKDAKELVEQIDCAVQKYKEESVETIVDCVCEELHMPMLKMNPLFQRTVQAHLL